MRYGKVFISLFTVVFVLTIFLAYTQEVKNQEQGSSTYFRVLVPSGDRMEEIQCYERKPGLFYVYLPSYAQLSELRIASDETHIFSINETTLIDGMSCDQFELETTYPVMYEKGVGEIMFLRSGNVPTLYIDLPSGNLSYLNSSKDHEEPGKMRLYEKDGALDCNTVLESMSGRGNSTWDQKKKPYNLKLSAQADLLGMGSAEKWILLANMGDRSHLRNKIVTDFASASEMAYTPDSRWVDLYVNGEYQGLYQLSERNEIHPQRINEPEDSSYLVSIDLLWRMENQNYPHIIMESNTALRIQHGEAHQEQLQEKWQSLENAIKAEDGIDPVTGTHYLDLIDLDSWAKKYLVEEIFGNYDAGTLSQFFYGSILEDKIYAGPVWDYDSTMGYVFGHSVPNVFHANRPYLRAGMNDSWFHYLYQKPEFYDRVVEIYQKEMRPLLEKLLDTGIQNYASQIFPAAKMNEYRWGGRTANEDTDWICEYLKLRMEFLDSIWLEGKEYCLVTVDVPGYFNATCFVISPGDTVPILPEYEDDGGYLGWYDLYQDIPFDPSQPIYEDTVIVLK